MRERDIELYLSRRVKALGGRAYKFISPGNDGVPDRLVCLPGGDPRNIKQADSREINSILESLPEWTRSTNGIRFGPYGFQRGFTRK